jgi:hypothetical protein
VEQDRAPIVFLHQPELARQALGEPRGHCEFDFSLAGVPRRVLDVYRRRAVVEEPYELRRHPASLRLTLLASFGVLRMQEITDTLVDLLLEIVHRLELKAERKADKELLEDLKRVHSLWYQMTAALKTGRLSFMR